MAQPIILDIPHDLGRAGARERLAKGTGQIAGIVPGGSLKEHRWDGDTLYLTIEAMGQRIASRIEVDDTIIHAVLDLPPLAALFASTIKEQLGKVGTKLLR
jgi:hypothetical protein